MTDSPYLTAHLRAAPMAQEASGPLKGLRVIDLTRALAGPYCTMLLADLGADVIKIEPPEGEFSRYSDPFTEDDTEQYYGGYFASINRNKRGVMLDFSKEADRETVRRLCRTADVVIENFRTGVMDKLGLGYETLSAENPKLVYAAIRGFGDPRTGVSPYVDWPAYDVVAQAMGGVVATTGTEDGQVLKFGPSIGDVFPGTLTAVGILAAVMHARDTGKGQFVDVAMYDALVSLADASVYRYSYRGIVTRPTGNSHPQLSPFDIYPTKDGACAIAAPNPLHWDLLCGLIGRPELIDDPRTFSNKDRVEHSAFVKEVVRSWTMERTTAEVVAELGGIVPVGPVNDARALFADEHLRTREMLVAVENPGGERPVVLPGAPIKLSESPAGVYRRPPLLGEHNAEVFAELEDIENANPGR